MPQDTVTVDVRDDIHRGREPFSRIMASVAALQAHQQLRLLAPFEPAPLFAVLAQQGFSHLARPLAGGDWEVIFTRRSQPQPRASAPTGRSDKKTVRPPARLDARGLEPPEPLVRILQALENLPADQSLYAQTDRKPMHLFAHLQQRGFASETSEQPDGSYVTRIFRG